jgi:hypothetical protein
VAVREKLADKKKSKSTDRPETSEHVYLQNKHHRSNFGLNLTFCMSILSSDPRDIKLFLLQIVHSESIVIINFGH